MASRSRPVVVGLPLWALPWCGALAVSACVEVPDFPDQSLIDRPRVLAMIAEPPEVAPGQSSSLRLLVAGFEREPRVSWYACGTFSTSIMSTQYGDQPERLGCGGAFTAPLGTGERGELPGALSDALFDNLELASEILGALLPLDTIERVKTRVGLPVLVEASLETPSDGLERAVKRVLISENRKPHTNPPPPHFLFNAAEPGRAVEIVASADDAMRCEAWDASPVTFEPGTAVELAPVVGGDEEPWIESYRVIDARGEERERREKAFYSWFATGGSLDQGVTEAPLRNELWRTPSEPGEAMLYVVVRDGHGGTSACVLSTIGVEPR